MPKKMLVVSGRETPGLRKVLERRGDWILKKSVWREAEELALGYVRDSIPVIFMFLFTKKVRL